jgi:UDP-galactopyranose mutase
VKIYFGGRLARYTYINTAEAVQSGLDTFAAIAADQRDTEPA